MDIPASNWDGTGDRGSKRLTNYGTTKYDLGEKACGPNEKIVPIRCAFFFSGRCLAGNRCSHSHNNQTHLNFNNYKPDDRSERMESRVYIAPAREGSEGSGTVSGPDIAAASTNLYDPVTDSLDLVTSILAEEEAKLRAFKFPLVELVKELLSPTWKKQKINKESYKKIVEKVVNKVMSSVQSSHIPQTQENINSYLAVSKPNISKLVQAYVKKERADVA